MAPETDGIPQENQGDRDLGQLPLTEVIWTNTVPQVESEDTPGSDGRPHSEMRGYEILSCLGHGGMSVIYKAKDLRLNRIVALKMILAGMHNNPRLLNRFHSEASIIARLHHPNIIQIFEVGEYQGLPYLALEFCSGGNLQSRQANKPMPPREAAALVENLARAIHIAHQVGIVHRDLKPANILFLEDGTAKISDFGLAKQLDSDQGQTRPGFVVGTPSYMAPEQSGQNKHVVGPPTDVYALGAILYQLLTGRPPFQGTTSLETLVQVMENEPVRPIQLQPRTPYDLETICLKCLEKEPQKRYATAQALAEDLHRFQAGESIAARPVSWHERMVKAIRRRPAVSALLALALVLLVVGVGGITWKWSEADKRAADLEVEKKKADQLANREATANQIAQKERKTAEENARKAKEAEAKALSAEARARQAEAKALRSLANSKLIVAKKFWDDLYLIKDDPAKPRPFLQVELVRHLLQEVPEEFRSWDWNYLNRLATGGLKTLTTPEMKNVTGVAHDGALKTIYSVSADGDLRGWKADTGELLKEINTGHNGGPLGVTWHGEANLLATWDALGSIKVWDAVELKLVKTWPAHNSQIVGAAFSPDGNLLATGGRDGAVKLWEARTGNEVAGFTDTKAEILALAWFPKGKFLAVAANGLAKTKARIILWDTETKKEKTRFDEQPRDINALAVSPDETLVATAGADGIIRFWDVSNGKQVAALNGHFGGNTCVSFSADGKRLAVGGRDCLKLFDVQNRTEHFTLKGHSNIVSSVGFSQDGNRLVSGSLDGSVKLWDSQSSNGSTIQAASAKKITAAALGPVGKLAWAIQSGEIYLGHLNPDGQPIRLPGHESDVIQLAFSPNGKNLASGDAQGLLKVWDSSTGELTASHSAGEGPLQSLTWMDGNCLLWAGANQSFTSWGINPETALQALSWPTSEEKSCLALARSGNLGAFQKKPGIIDVWELTSTDWQKNCSLRPGDNVKCAALSPDGRRLATGDAQSTITLWDIQTGQLIMTLKSEPGQIEALAFGPDGNYLLSVHALTGKTGEYVLKCWDGRPVN